MTINQLCASRPLTCSKSQHAKRFSVLRTSIKALCLLSLANFSFASDPQTNPVNSQWVVLAQNDWTNIGSCCARLSWRPSEYIFIT